MDNKLKNIIRIVICVVLVAALVLGLVFGIKSCNDNNEDPDTSSSDTADVDNSSDDDTDDDNTDDDDDDSDDDDDEWDNWDEGDDWDETEEGEPEEETPVEEEPEEEPEEEEPEEEEPEEEEPEEEEEIDDDPYYEPIIINNDEPYLNENFLGFNGVYMLFTHMKHPSYGVQYTDEQATIELDRIQKMGIKIVRTQYSGGMVYKSVGSGTNKQWEAHWDDSPYLNAFIKTAKELKARDIEIAMPFTWYLASLTKNAQPYAFGDGYFPASITGTGWAVQSDTGYGTYGNETPEEQERILEANTASYKQFVKDSITKFRAEGLTNITYIMGPTEANNAYMKDGARDYDRVCEIYDVFMTATHDALSEINLRKEYKIVGPNDNWGGEFYEFDEEKYSTLVNYTLENLSEEVDIIATHNGYNRANYFSEDDFYQRPNRMLANPMNSTKAAGKEFWIDEYNVATNVEYTPDQKREVFNNVISGVAFGSMVNGIMNMGGVSNVFIWQLVEQQWPHEQNGGEFDKGVQVGTGFMPNLYESSRPKSAWYSYAMLQRYIGQGKLVKCNDGLGIDTQLGFYYSCIERADGEMTIIITNYEPMDFNVEVNFMKELDGKTFYRHEYAVADVQRTVDAIIPEISGKGENIKTGFLDTLKPMSVTVYTTESK